MRLAVRPAAALSLLPLLLALVGPAPSAGKDLEDLLWDFQVAPLDAAPAAPFALEALDGRRLSLAGLRGRAVLLYFWSST